MNKSCKSLSVSDLCLRCFCALKSFQLQFYGAVAPIAEVPVLYFHLGAGAHVGQDVAVVLDGVVEESLAHDLGSVGIRIRQPVGESFLAVGAPLEADFYLDECGARRGPVHGVLDGGQNAGVGEDLDVEGAVAVVVQVAVVMTSAER